MFNEIEQIFYGEIHNICQKWAHYFDIYERHLSRFKGHQVRLLEIGVSQGGSLDIWRRYFGEHAVLFGVDIDPNCKRFEAANVHIEIGSQDDPNFLKDLAARLNEVDIIIDDGGHTMGQQINTFEYLFPIVQERGVYICEDTHTSYQPQFGGGLGDKVSFIEMIKGKVDELHAFHPGGPTPTRFSLSADSVAFYESMVVIEKRPASKPRTTEVEVGRQT
jgi:hypothetical protein